LTENFEDIITKNVALSYYPNSDAAIKALDDGIYKIDLSGTVSQYKEVPGIGRVIVDNEVIRVLLHSP
jgi:hypothetical protein